MITIVDYGGSNLASIMYSLNRLGVSAKISRDKKTIKKSRHVILPGVTSAHTAMNNLIKYSLIDEIRSLTQPVLGICLGMQILFEYSEEWNIPCLLIIPGRVKALIPDKDLSVPHIGWNAIHKINDNLIIRDIPDLSYVYYVHRYVAPIGLFTSAVTSHTCSFSASIQHRNFFGTQFHPERSGPIGARILKNFLEL
jgi:glutamine amidotransferase